MAAEELKFLICGDICGEEGLEFFTGIIPGYVRDNGIYSVIVNGENAASGFGLEEKHCNALFDSGVDVITGGNHIFEKKDFHPYLNSAERVIRPGNYPPGAPGKGWCLVDKGGFKFVVVNLQGREYLSALDCPFRWMDGFLGENQFYPDIPVLLDFHGESGEEKEALGFYLDGRITAFWGTHTHVQTADNRILPKGTAYITDLGMTGAINSVIGSDIETSIKRNKMQILYKTLPARGPCMVQGIILTLNKEDGKALSVDIVTITEN